MKTVASVDSSIPKTRPKYEKDDSVLTTCSDALPATQPTHAQRTTTTAQEIFDQADLTDDLQALEQLLLERSSSRSELIAAAGAHTVLAGGKRLRAAQTLLAARLGTYDFEQAKHAAATVELIHAASLVHDDLVDHAARRRGQVTVHTQWDSDVALMVGDYFFAQAAAEMALCGDPRIVTIYATAVQTVVSGELHPVTHVEPLETALAQYERKIGAKTAALFEAGCKAGMAMGAGSEDDIAALGRYGYDLGLAFQVVDDILDFTSTTETLGKPAGNDLREGTITLPLIYAVTNSDNTFLRSVARNSELSDEQVSHAVAEVHQLGGIEQARKDAIAYLERAISHLDRFPESIARTALINIGRFVVLRHF